MNEIFSSTMLIIFGADCFKKYAEEFNKATGVLRQCQAELKMVPKTDSVN